MRFGSESQSIAQIAGTAFGFQSRQALSQIGYTKQVLWRSTLEKILRTCRMQGAVIYFEQSKT